LYLVYEFFLNCLKPDESTRSFFLGTKIVQDSPRMAQQLIAEGPLSYGGPNCPTASTTSLPGPSPPDKEPSNEKRRYSENISGFDLADEFSHDDLLFFSSLYTRGSSQSAEDPLCFSPVSTSNTLSSPTESFCGTIPGVSDKTGECHGDYTHTRKVPYLSHISPQHCRS
jgi:hypothetical protein